MTGPTQNGVLKRDDNDTPVMGGTSSSDNATIINSAFDPITRRLLVDNAGGGAGTVTEVDTGTGLTGGPITTTGTISLDSKLAPLDTLGTAGQLIRVNAGRTALEYFTAASGGVASVVGTANRITVDSTDPANPIVDISAAYVGQTSITTLGTIGTGTWAGTTIALNKGGTGQTTKAAAFDALQPMTTGGDIIYGGASGTGTRLANGSSGQVLTSGGTTVAPTWQTPTTGTVTAVSVASANGFTGSSSGGATPALTIATSINSPILAGNGTAISAATTTGTGSTAVLSASPALTGSPTAPTQTTGDNTTKIATDAFVTTAIANAIAGVNPAIAVQAATTAAGDTSGFTYNNGVSGIGATLTQNSAAIYSVDGFTFNTLGQRLLVKNDTQSPSGAFNGVYYVTTVGTGIIPAVLTRALDYDTPSDINNTGAIPVVNGTTNANTSWLLTSTIATVGTDPLTYTQFSIAPSTLVVGPASATDGVPALFNGTTGKLIKNSTPTGTGNPVMQTSPSLTTPALGVATATSINKMAITAPASASTLAVADGKTFTVNNTITLAAGADSQTFTFPAASATVAGLGTTQTFTGQDKFNNFIDVNNAVTVTSNAGTVPVTFRLNTFTNSSAATMAITMATSSAVDGQMTIVRIYDFSAVAQTIGWTNTENSTVSVPTTSNGSTTLPLTVGFMYNSQTSKWRCIALA